VWDYKGDPENHVTDLGREQVQKAGNDLKKSKIDIIISSPIVRTMETARIVAETIGYDPEKIIIDNRIIEWQVGGDFQGRQIDEYISIRNASENRYTFKTESGESYQDVVRRCGEFLYDIESQYQGKNILITAPVISITL
jgi:probable phosphoglycerate mutase